PVPAPAPPHFSRTVPQPQPAEKPPPTPSPTPARRPQPAAKPFNFNQLQQIIARARASGHQASSAARGPARAETAPQARPNAGQRLSESDLAGLTQLLERLWNPNCDVAGGSSVRVQVKFLVGLSGDLLGSPSAGGLEHSPNAVVAAAARRALDAVRQAAPYSEPYYGQSIVVNFDAKEACANR
ncbi:MAG: energy transducer TonB, partial [Caulobacteraceae bacterium]